MPSRWPAVLPVRPAPPLVIEPLLYRGPAGDELRLPPAALAAIGTRPVVLRVGEDTVTLLPTRRAVARPWPRRLRSVADRGLSAARGLAGAAVAALGLPVRAVRAR